MSDDSLRAYAREKRFSAATVERWLTAEDTDRRALLCLATELRLGENQFRDVFDLLQDIAARRGYGIAEVLADRPVAAVMHTPAGRSDKIKALKAVLRRLRYPQLAAVEKRLDELRRQLGLSQGIVFELPQNLEGESISIRFSGRSAVELRGHASALVAALQKEQVEEMFRILEGGW